MTVQSRFVATALAVGILLAAPAAAGAAGAQTDAEAQAIEATLTYSTGTLTVGDAGIALPTGFRYLSATDADKVMHDMYGNPPDPTLAALIVPDNATALTSSYVVAVVFDTSGHVSDKDAAAIDYAKMLAQLQKDAVDQNPARAKDGYFTYTIVGWAEQPSYDAVTHKLYWATELAVPGVSEDTLNYRVRVLGREGTLELDAISTIGDLPSVKESMAALLRTSTFGPGQAYADYKEGDKTSALTVAALVGGGAYVAAKTGLIALILAKAKFILVGLIALFGLVRKRLVRRLRGRSSTEPGGPPAEPDPATEAEPITEPIAHVEPVSETADGAAPGTTAPPVPEPRPALGLPPPGPAEPPMPAP